MESLPLISVIVPVYKVEAYLDKCISSIAGQTYDHLEIILVDDGSADSCPGICDAWAARDSRIRVIHKENGGLSDARNAGMAAATGELMAFVDSDDWISRDMIRLLYDNMVTCCSQISACGVEMVWEDGTPPRMLTQPGCRILDTREAMAAIIEESYLKQPVWYKLYRTDLIRDIPFAVGKCHEDVFWSYQALGRAKRISVMDAPCYHYLQRGGSIMGQSYSLKRLDALEAKCRRQAYLQQNFPELTGMGKRDLFWSCLYQGQQALRFLDADERNHVIRTLKPILKTHPLSGADMGTLRIDHKIWYLTSRIWLEGVCRLRNLLRIGV